MLFGIFHSIWQTLSLRPLLTWNRETSWATDTIAPDHLLPLSGAQKEELHRGAQGNEAMRSIIRAGDD